MSNQVDLDKMFEQTPKVEETVATFTEKMKLADRVEAESLAGFNDMINALEEDNNKNPSGDQQAILNLLKVVRIMATNYNQIRTALAIKQLAVLAEKENAERT